MPTRLMESRTRESARPLRSMESSVSPTMPFIVPHAYGTVTVAAAVRPRNPNVRPTPAPTE